MHEACRWGERGARINPISPGVIVTPLAVDEFNGPHGGFCQNMFAKCPAGRPGTADEIGPLAEFVMSLQGAFVAGSDFLAGGGATASYHYDPLQPDKQEQIACNGPEKPSPQPILGGTMTGEETCAQLYRDLFDSLMRKVACGMPAIVSLDAMQAQRRAQSIRI